MADLDIDTRVEGADGRYRGELKAAWSVWFPHGGYMIAMALRAAGLHSELGKPLSLTCHFLSVPAFGPVAFDVTTLRRSRTVESMRVSMRQGDRHVLELLIWVGRDVPGYAHDDTCLPDVPDWETLTPTTELEGALAPHPHWQNLEHRPITPLHWQVSDAGAPRHRDWIRVRGFEAFDDAFLNAGRLAVILDSYGWPAAAMAHAGDARYIAPTLSLTVDFHRASRQSWVLSDAYAPVAANGTIALENRVWDRNSGLLATALGTMRCRPRDGR